LPRQPCLVYSDFVFSDESKLCSSLAADDRDLFSEVDDQQELSATSSCQTDEIRAKSQFRHEFASKLELASLTVEIGGGGDSSSSSSKRCRFTQLEEIRFTSLRMLQ
jgi:hypothetical protein